MSKPVNIARPGATDGSRDEMSRFCLLMMVVAQALGSAGPPVPSGAPGVTAAAEGSAAEHYLATAAGELPGRAAGQRVRCA